MAQPASDGDEWITDAAAQLDQHIDETSVYDRLQPRLRATVRRGVPIATDAAGIEINTRALRLVLARRVWDVCEREIAALEFASEGKAIQGIRVDLVGRYDDQLGVLGDQVREAIRSTLTGLVGSASADRVGIELRWTDLEP